MKALQDAISVVHLDQNKSPGIIISVLVKLQNLSFHVSFERGFLMIVFSQMKVHLMIISFMCLIFRGVIIDSLVQEFDLSIIQQDANIELFVAIVSSLRPENLINVILKFHMFDKFKLFHVIER